MTEVARHGLTSAADHRLARAAHLHVRELGHDAFVRTRARAHTVDQTSSIDALLRGAYEGDVTIGELRRHGDLGLGTVQQLDGEMVLVDGECFQVRADGTVHRVDDDVRTPFAVVCRFRPGAPVRLPGPLPFGELTQRLDELASGAIVQAVRVDGDFTDLALRSVPRQEPPYRPLSEVVHDQTEWSLERARGSLVGFRFPDEAQGIDVAGYHLHFIADDRTTGGHVLDLVLEDGVARLDGASELRVEVPDGVELGEAGADADRDAEIRAVEGGPRG
jgi:acetolactate decarboxylase